MLSPTVNLVKRLADGAHLETAVQHIPLRERREDGIEGVLVRRELGNVDWSAIPIEEDHRLFFRSEQREQSTKKRRSPFSNSFEFELRFGNEGIQSELRLVVFLLQGGGDGGGKKGHGRCCLLSALLQEVVLEDA